MLKEDPKNEFMQICSDVKNKKVEYTWQNTSNICINAAFLILN